MQLSLNLAPLWWLRWAPVAGVIAFVLYLLYVIGRVAVVPVLASFALAYLLNPLVKRIERCGVARPYAVLVALTVVALIAGAFLTFIIPELWSQASAAGQKLLSYFTPENAARQRYYLKRYSPFLDRFAGERMELVLRSPSEALGAPAKWLFGGLSGFLSAAASSLDLLLVPFFVFYLLIDFNHWRDSIEDLIPPRFRQTFSRLFDEVGRILEAYVRGQLLIALVMAALYAAGFSIIRLPAWAGVAMLTGLLNIIPYLGTALGMTLAIGFTLADGGSFWRIAGVGSVFAVVQIIESYYLTPRILGARLSLHPIAVFLGMLIGGKLFGLLGVILAVPMIAVVKVFLMFFRELYKGSHFYHAGKVNSAEAASEALEERLAVAAEIVLQEQTQAQTGTELLTPGERKDDPAAQVVS